MVGCDLWRKHRKCPPIKKTAAAIQQEVAKELDRLLRAIFQEQSKTGRLDLEAVEMALRSALHRAGARALSQLLQGSPPAAGERTLPCPCGQHADYKELRTQTILAVVGLATVQRPYDLSEPCGAGPSRRPKLEALRRGWHRAVLKVGDGAVWIWNLAQEYFPGAVCIVDLYHACWLRWRSRTCRTVSGESRSQFASRLDDSGTDMSRTPGASEPSEA